MDDKRFSEESYLALSTEPTALTNEFDINWYKNGGLPKHGFLEITMPLYGLVDGTETNKYKIAYTTMGDSGPWILFLHGVPTNRTQYYTLQKKLSRFCRTISIDMLGMGESSMPLKYGFKTTDQGTLDRLKHGQKPWDWIFDTIYIEQIRQKLMDGKKFFFVADDWGGGILSHYAALIPNASLGNIWINPIAFDGYPVSEIQAFGRASQLNEQDLMKALGDGDQTMVQIFKTMVYNPNKWNQYSLRNIKRTYIDVDYARNKVLPNGEREYANSLTLRLKPVAMKVLTDRSAILSSRLLLPYHEKLNPFGVDYTKITSPCKIIWGGQDNMMPERQMWRFVNVIRNAEVQTHTVQKAGHFSAVDQPELVAESILGFIASKPQWRKMLAQPFIGFGVPGAIYKGDEEHVLKSFNQLYNK